MDSEHVSMAADGELIIPAALHRALGLENGGPLVASIEDGGIRLVPLQNVIRSVQANVPQYVPIGIDLAAELSADRRDEAEREEAVAICNIRSAS